MVWWYCEWIGREWWRECGPCDCVGYPLFIVCGLCCCVVVEVNGWFVCIFRLLFIGAPFPFPLFINAPFLCLIDGPSEKAEWELEWDGIVAVVVVILLQFESLRLFLDGAGVDINWCCDGWYLYKGFVEAILLLFTLLICDFAWLILLILLWYGVLLWVFDRDDEWAVFDGDDLIEFEFDIDRDPESDGDRECEFEWEWVFELVIEFDIECGVCDAVWSNVSIPIGDGARFPGLCTTWPNEYLLTFIILACCDCGGWLEVFCGWANEVDDGGLKWTVLDVSMAELVVVEVDDDGLGLGIECDNVWGWW